jgi:hypothetical protein
MARGESVDAKSHRSHLRRWLDRLIASDPALDHLKTGARAVFVAMVFLAFEARRFGPRGNGLGMAVLYAYFFALLLQSKPEALAWQTLLLFAGYAIAGAVRFVPIADDPQATLRHMRCAMRAMADAVAGNADALASSLEGKRGGAFQPLPRDRAAFSWSDDTDAGQAAKSRILANWRWEANEAVKGMPREA